MQKDHWGYQLTTDSADAAGHMIDALRSFSRWQVDMMAHLDAAIQSDPGFALPYIVKGITICTLRRPEALPKARALLDKALAARPVETQREKHYLKALNSALDARLNDTVTHYELIAKSHPHDLFALRQSQLELFWMGEAQWMRDITERAAPHWSAENDGFAHFQAMRAFGLEETIDYQGAEACARQSVELDPTEIWGTHAMAHVLIMQARLDEGIDWIKNLTGNWQGCNHIVHHVWWHLALFHTERGDYDAALQVYDDKLRDLNSPLLKAIPDYLVDIQNDVSLLQRLELRGIDTKDRWQPIADLATGWIENPMSCFTSPHATLALAAAGRTTEAKDLISNLKAMTHDETPGDLTGKMSIAAIPACEAALAFRQNDHTTVVNKLYPHRRQLWHMGGSHAQRDLFMQLLCTSAHKTGQTDKLQSTLNELDALGFEHMDERTSYRSMIADLHTHQA